MARVLVTGGNGFLGKYVVKELEKRNYKVFAPTKQECNLLYRNDCEQAIRGCEYVIHLAAVVGGIGANRAHPYDFFYQNLLMGINMFDVAMKARIKKFVTLGTICSYPKHTSVPFRESALWLGYPEETNAPYGLAKKMLLVQGQAARQQYDFSSIYLLQVNLYGPGDNFDLESSHVIPAMISKFVDAKKSGKKKVTLWGDGSPTREFLYVEDAARGIINAMEKYDKPDPINLGSGMEITIFELAQRISRIVGYDGEVVWDKSKPNGQPRRCLDVTKAQAEFGFKATTDFQEGLRKTIAWYKNGRA